jgi:hypothetical protein
MIIAQFPIEIHSERGQFAESPLKTVGNVHSLGDYYAIRSSCVRVQIVAYDETRKVFLVSSPIRIILVVYYRYCCENDFLLCQDRLGTNTKKSHTDKKNVRTTYRACLHL